MDDVSSALSSRGAGNPPRAGARPLRVWPALVALALMIATRFGPRFVADGPPWLWMVGVLGPAAGCLLVLLWWLFASRATARERVLGALGLLLAAAASVLLSHPTVRGPVVITITLPLGFAGFALCATAAARARPRVRAACAVAGAAVAFAVPLLWRSEGVRGDFRFELRWRWTPTSEELMLTEAAASVVAPAAAEAAFDVTAAPWPGFRGPGRDARVTSVSLAEDWDATPPERLWKVPVGPGWSSFAVAGGHLFTAEQRGPSEATVCLDAATGERVWMRTIDARFEESMSGPGPRATPTVADGALYALGADGNLARLEPQTGALLWEVDVAALAEREPPPWGFSGSPLVLHERVIVHAGGAGTKGTLAFDAATGVLAWSAPAGDHSYASPERVQLLGEEHVAVLTNAGLDLLDPATGAVRLAYAWPHAQYRALQPQELGDDGLLLPTGAGGSTRRVRLTRTGAGLAAEELWTSRFLKPDFNDFVVHGEHAFGFDGSLLTCIDLATGARVWKDGRYGKGQVLLVSDSSHLLVTAEDGEVVLVAADPSAHRELGRFQALDGKTWNHAALVGERLYLRNGQEAACYRLPLAGTGDAPGF